jgi:hypothetical protein
MISSFDDDDDVPTGTVYRRIAGWRAVSGIGLKGIFVSFSY